MTKVFTIAHMPQELVQKWLQHLRDFDTAHPGCHFEVAAEPPPDVTVAEMVRSLQINPGLTFTTFFERAPEPTLEILKRFAKGEGPPWTPCEMRLAARCYELEKLLDGEQKKRAP